MKEPKYNGNVESKNVVNVNNRLLKKKLKRIGRMYWIVANQLIRQSIAFRMAVVNKSKLGKIFFNMFDICELFGIFKEYQDIADRFGTNMKMQRTWINQEQRDGSFK